MLRPHPLFGFSTFRVEFPSRPERIVLFFDNIRGRSPLRGRFRCEEIHHVRQLARSAKRSARQVISSLRVAGNVALSRGRTGGHCLVVAYHTGLRRGSLLGLRWADVDLAGATAKGGAYQKR
jgi:integrase